MKDAKKKYLENHASLNTLSLVHAPFSSQEADWYSESEEFRKFVSSSQLYMITHREGIEFRNFQSEGSDGEITHFRFDLVGHSKKVENVKLNIAQFHDELGETITVYYGPKIIRLEGDVVIEFTIERLLFLYYRGLLELEIADSYRTLLEFDLLYVGISKESDSFSRLMDQRHKGKEKIFSNEGQKNPIARLTDEIFILLFNVEDLQIKTFGIEAEIENILEAIPIDKNRLVSDAEKAFVHVLKSKYNKQPYKNYPRCLDGLAGLGLDRYSYVLGENLSLRVGSTVFVGGFDRETGWVAFDRCDMLAISGESVILVEREQ